MQKMCTFIFPSQILDPDFWPDERDDRSHFYSKGQSKFTRLAFLYVADENMFVYRRHLKTYLECQLLIELVNEYSY